MKRISKILKLLIMAIISLIILTTHTQADVGSFESYDSGGSSWGGSSSWDSSSSWSSWDDDYSYSSSGRSSSGNSSSAGDIIWLVIVVGIMVIVVATKQKGLNRRKGPLHQINNNYRPMDQFDKEKEQMIEQQIKQIDELFNKEEFIAWTKNLFVKLQQAWTDRDWSTIRTFETNELYEQHKNQLEGYIKNNQINVMDRICVNYANLCDFRQEGDKDILTVRLNSRMADYIIDATTKRIIRGDKNTERVNTYLLTFIRKTGVKTQAGTNEIKTTNCPNCGAPTQITSSGKCEYCGSVITTGEYSWALANLERDNGQQNNNHIQYTINNNRIYK